MEHTIWLWVGFFSFVIGIIIFDLGLTKKHPHVISTKEALWRSFAYLLLGLCFGGGIWYLQGAEKGVEFFTGYLIELSLSVDNIFVFVLVFTYFSVPQTYQHRVLFWGILGALLMRGVLIFIGAELILMFHWILYIFGGFLVLTGIKMLVAADDTPDMEHNRVVTFMRSRFRVTEDFHKDYFFERIGGLLWMTPLFIVLMLIELTDLVFALDSIPAIFAITHDPFIIYTSNVFAILGLRSLYFALAGIVHRFKYLKYGLSLVLLVIGTKMLVNTYFDAKIIPTELALIVTGILISGSILLSLIKTRGQAPAELTGWIPGNVAKDDGEG